MYFIRFSLDPPIVSSEHLPYCSGNNFQKCFFIYLRIELLKNSIIQINKTALIDRFHETKTDEELIFQQL
ncbi:hypothetical protein LBK6_14170 [Leptospira borgpetersenii serovar Hardjo]|nr:hypothetical protein LBK6_14170 [Leptospira borgpetersenii serovar Hardjo]AMX62652.1 hypothetical protein LBK9_14090 [Leptospira borgpetersenii serovar Hardjo]AMX65895.1 hypothetical protein LBK30_14100 [Leptospira borgpetersenii serovar Hardjo]AMX69128.1 hypothetical protein LBHA_14055 [Leptospira borgpetersenii serovar Hardjo]AMX70209.1 hypothetical protein LBHB_02385 [Leptospira borgpetersenii serovar Hardjo]